MRWCVFMLLLCGCVPIIPFGGEKKPASAPLPPETPTLHRSLKTMAVAAAPRTITFYWEWVVGPAGNTESNCVFNIFSTADITRPRNSWSFKASFPGTARSFQVWPTNNMEFFEINVSNSQTHLVSAWTKFKM